MDAASAHHHRWPVVGYGGIAHHDRRWLAARRLAATTASRPTRAVATAQRRARRMITMFEFECCRASSSQVVRWLNVSRRVMSYTSSAPAAPR
uniref:Uncharacterized protein n=1 Tax=Anopheles dirus TaxID=7168 RepID=A0A182NH04_9DIPT